MKRYIRVHSEFIELPPRLVLHELRHDSVKRLIHAVEKGIFRDVHTVAIVDSLRLKDTSVVRIVTKKSGGLIYWLVQDWLGRENWAGGFFRYGSKEHAEEAAVASPAMRGRGLYMAVLRHIRKTYKRPLISDRTLSVANVMSWVRAGAVVGEERFRINPKPWIHQFACLETITVGQRKIP